MPLPVGIISFVLIIINSWHVIAAFFARPPNMIFTAIAHYYQDYFLYVSYIAQGIRGVWVREMYTNEPVAPFRYYWPYVFSGNIGGIFHLSPFAIYNILLLIMVALVLFVIWRMCRRLFSNSFSVTLAFLFAATASNFFDIGAFFRDGSLRLLGLTWFSPTPALNRLGGVPHQTMQTVLLLTLAYAGSSLLRKGRLKSWYVAAIVVVGLVIGFLNPLQAMLLVGSFGLVSIMNSLQTKRYDGLLRMSLLVALPALAGVLLAKVALADHPIFINARAWEMQQYIQLTFMEFVVGFGPILLLIPFGIRDVFGKKDPLWRVLAVYAIATTAGFFSPLPARLGIEAVRWLHPAAYVFFPLIATLGFLRVPKRMYPWILTGYLLLTVPAIAAQVDARMSPAPLSYVPVPVVNALTALKMESFDGVVLTNPVYPYDMLVPIFSGHPSFTGHMLHTLNVNEKERLRADYFAGRMTEAQKKQFLIDYNIGYVIHDLP